MHLKCDHGNYKLIYLNYIVTDEIRILNGELFLCLNIWRLFFNLTIHNKWLTKENWTQWQGKRETVSYLRDVLAIINRIVINRIK